jgi:hypothetical protein
MKIKHKKIQNNKDDGLLVSDAMWTCMWVQMFWGKMQH